MFNNVKKKLIQDIKNIYNNANVLEVNVDIEQEKICYIYLNIKTIRLDKINDKQFKYYVTGELLTLASSPCDRQKGYFLDGYYSKEFMNKLPTNKALTIGLYETFNGDTINITFEYISEIFNFANCKVEDIKDININTQVIYG